MTNEPADEFTTPGFDPLDSIESSELLDNPELMRQRLAEEGFLFFRGLLPASTVGEVRAAVIGAIEKEGWIAAGTDPEDRRPGPVVVREADERWFPGYQRMQSLECFHSLAHEDRLVSLCRDLLDGPVLVHPRKIGRVTFPGSEYPTPPHQDFPFIQGTPDVLTIWLPLAECGPRDGALRVLRRSTRVGLRTREPKPGVGGVGVPVAPGEAHDWASADYRPGDALVFHSFTVHWAPPNHGERLRLSCDYRYQRVEDPVVEGSLRPHYWPTIPDWEVLTEGWSTTRWVEGQAEPAISEMMPPLGELEVGPVRLVRTGAPGPDGPMAGQSPDD